MKARIISALAICSLTGMALHAAETETTATEQSENSDNKKVAVILPFTSAYDAEVAGAASATAMSKTESSPKIKITPSGRVLADAAVYAPDGNGLTDGFAVPDLRVGVKAEFGKWLAKVDVGFGGFKFSPKDVYIQYTFNEHNLLRGGYFVHQFGLQSCSSSSFKAAIEAPTSDTYLNATGRNLGLMYVLDKPKFFWGVSAVFGNVDDLTANKVTRVNVGGITRLVWRPIAREGAVAQVGISAWYQSPMYKSTNPGGKGEVNLSANFPTRVSKVKMLAADISYAGNQVKISPELLLSYDRFALETQYYYSNIRQHRGLGSNTVQGAYAWLRCLLFGETQYKYSHADAGLATPTKKTLEIVAGYDYTNAGKYEQFDENGQIQQIRAGISNEASVTLNYYINKYLLCRLGWRYVTAHDSQALAAFNGRRHVNIIQARIQFKF